MHLDGSHAGQAFETHGAIWAKYIEMGGSGSALGLPITDEYVWNEGRRSDFEHGDISWNGGIITATIANVGELTDVSGIDPPYQAP